jgi:hypothetical protein
MSPPSFPENLVADVAGEHEPALLP